MKLFMVLRYIFTEKSNKKQKGDLIHAFNKILEFKVFKR